MRYSWLIGCVLLSGCGVAYISPKVSDQGTDSTVEVIALTSSSINEVNSETYTPRALPAAFSQRARVAMMEQRPRSRLSAITLEERRPKRATLKPPPDLTPAPYKIGVGDVVLLATRQAATNIEELTGLLAASSKRQGYTVQDDGSITIPDVGRIRIGDLTLEDAEAEVFRKLVDSQIDPSFSIEIAEFNSKRVAIGGSVNTPVIVPVTLVPPRLSDVITAAKGIKSTDRESTVIRIYREGTLYQIPLDDFFNQPRLQKIYLQAGDNVFVDADYNIAQAQRYFEEQIKLKGDRRADRSQALQELQTQINMRRAALDEDRATFLTKEKLGAVDRDYVYLTGEVSQQGRFPLPFEQRAKLADALFSKNGVPTITGNVGQIYVLRAAVGPDNQDIVKALHLDARNAVNIVLATKLELRPNDIIFVAEQPVTRWSRALTQIGTAIVTTTAAAVQAN